MADYLYNRFLYDCWVKNHDLDNNDIKCAIVDNGYTPSKDHNLWTDISSNEVSGSGYTPGGESLTGKLVTEDDANDLVVFDADNVVWSGVSFTNGRYAILYNATLAGDNLIAAFDFGSDLSPSSEDFTVLWDTDGILETKQA